jgi:hypothetical protein
MLTRVCFSGFFKRLNISANISPLSKGLDMIAKFSAAVPATLFALILAGCSSAGPTNSMGQKSSDPEADFLAGRIRLECQVSCSYAWASNYPRMYEAYTAQQWTLLASEVMRVGQGNDISYFFLGRAAEGLGKSEAAKNYYVLGRATPYRCNSPINNCKEIDVPTLTAQRLSALKAQTPLLVEQPAAKAPAPTAPLSPVSPAPVSTPSIATAIPVPEQKPTPNSWVVLPQVDARAALTEILNSAVQGLSLSLKFCRADQWLAKNLFAVRGFTILDKYSFPEMKGRSGPEALFMVRIDSSTQGGIAVTNNWYFTLATEREAGATHWCLTTLTKVSS